MVSAQAGDRLHVASSQRLAHRGTGDAQPMDLVAVHARYVETLGTARGIQHGVVARPFRAEPEVVADQYVLGAEAADQHVVDEVIRNL